MGEIPIDRCYTQPHLYRLCNKSLCIPWKQRCPCKTRSEFRCMAGNCIPISLQCDGIKQCLYGEDENLCELEQKIEQTVAATTAVTEASREGHSDKSWSLPTVVIITSVSVFVSILVLTFLFIVITRRKTKNTGQISGNSLRMTDNEAGSDDSDSDVFIEDRESESMYIPMKRAKYPFSVSDHSEYSISKYLSNHTDGILESENNSLGSTGDTTAKERENLAINPGAEIYNTDRSNEYRFSGLGRFKFIPTLKYFDNVIEHDYDKRPKDNLCVTKKCKNFSKTSSLPDHVIVYNDLKTI